jgi:exportin-1
LDHAVQPTTKFFALGILENLVRHRWNILPESQQRGIRDYIVDHVLKLSENDDQRNQQRVILSKMNAVLVLVRCCRKFSWRSLF